MLTRQNRLVILKPIFRKQGRGKILREIEIQYLKTKCNRLIEQAMSLEKRISETDQLNAQLRAAKKELEAELAAKGVNVADLELIPEAATGTTEGNATETAAEEHAVYNAETSAGSNEVDAVRLKETQTENQDKKLSQQRIFEMLRNVSVHIQPPDIASKPKKRMKVPLYKDFKKNCEQQEQERMDRDEIGAQAGTVIIYEKSAAGQKIKGILQLAGLIAAVGAAVCAAVIYLM